MLPKKSQSHIMETLDDDKCKAQHKQQKKNLSLQAAQHQHMQSSCSACVWPFFREKERSAEHRQCTTVLVTTTKTENSLLLGAFNYLKATGSN